MSQRRRRKGQNEKVGEMQKVGIIMGVEFVDKDTDLLNSKSITDSLFITQQLYVRYGHRYQ